MTRCEIQPLVCETAGVLVGKALADNTKLKSIDLQLGGWS